MLTMLLLAVALVIALAVAQRVVSSQRAVVRIPVVAASREAWWVTFMLSQDPRRTRFRESGCRACASGLSSPDAARVRDLRLRARDARRE